MTRLSCHRFRPNDLSLLATAWEICGGDWPPKEHRELSLTSLQQAGEDSGRWVKHARYYWLFAG